MKMTCHYCRSERSRGDIQMDHFPIPKRHGGTEVVPACATCHSLKDRVPMGKWAAELRHDGARSVADVLTIGAFSEDFVSKAVLDGRMPDEMKSHLLSHWEYMSWAGRLVAAKMIFIAMDGAEFSK